MRVVVPERRMVAELLAGGRLEGLAGELVDEQLRAIARGVEALRAAHEAPTDEAIGELAQLQGVAVHGRVIEDLRREGAMRRAA